jgi:hypothetical protein
MTAAMFRIVLQPDEQATLCAIRDGLFLEDLSFSVLSKLVALRMLEPDERGRLRLTLLAEAALERMSGRMH